uniref:G protein-coupled receptor 34b n=1 Tax=Hucho hucho TaxID=62062 RepID=A0A4W5K4T0_9TELE
MISGVGCGSGPKSSSLASCHQNRPALMRAKNFPKRTIWKNQETHSLNPESSYNKTQLLPTRQKLQSAVLYSVLFVLGLTGNILALWVFLYVHSKNNSVRVFLINVALADLLLVIYLPFRVSAICGMIWVLALASVIPMILLSEGNEESDKCFQYKQRQRAKGKAYFNLFLVATFWLVFVCFMVSYGKIGLKLLRMSREKPDFPNAPRYTRTARKLFFVLFLFTVCFVPYHMVRVFYVVSQISDTSCFWRGVVDKANEVVLLLSALNSCLDPVMYFLLSASVRKETLRLINNVFRLRDPESSVDRGRSLGEQPTVSFISNPRSKITVQPCL